MLRVGRMLSLGLAVVAITFFFAAPPADAGCTVQTSCSQGGGYTLSCSGQTCSSVAGVSVTCDGDTERCDDPKCSAQTSCSTGGSVSCVGYNPNRPCVVDSCQVICDGVHHWCPGFSGTNICPWWSSIGETSDQEFWTGAESGGQCVPESDAMVPDAVVPDAVAPMETDSARS